MNGILPLWKPKGMTSHDCVMKIRQLYKTKKVGHTGTLDPDAEGVLPICIGQATKIVPFLTDTKKTYIADVQLGSSTDTLDASGKVVDEKEVVEFPTREEIYSVLKQFTGTITQIPPMYSAIKVNGKKLYEYARKNIEVERPKRTVIIDKIELLAIHDDSFTIQVVCSKGTYIRSLCADIGEQLGYPAHMSRLIRTETASFSEKNSVTFATIKDKVSKNEQLDLLLPIEKGIAHLDKWYVDEVLKTKILHGQKLPKPHQQFKTDPFAVMYGKTLLAIYQHHPEKQDLIKPVRVFTGVRKSAGENYENI